jgi:Tfp pilus assembly protein PilO
MIQVVVQTPMPPEIPAFPPGLFEPWYARLPPAVTVIVCLGFFAACAVVLYPLMRAIGRRIEGRATETDPALRSEVEQLRARLNEVEALQHRVMELEERVDFAERLLSQRHEPQRLERGPAG